MQSLVIGVAMLRNPWGRSLMTWRRTSTAPAASALLHSSTESSSKGSNSDACTSLDMRKRNSMFHLQRQTWVEVFGGVRCPLISVTSLDHWEDLHSAAARSEKWLRSWKRTFATRRSHGFRIPLDYQSMKWTTKREILLRKFSLCIMLLSSLLLDGSLVSVVFDWLFRTFDKYSSLTPP